MDAGFDPTFAQTENSTDPNAGYKSHTSAPIEQKHDQQATTAMVLGIIGDVCFFPPLLNLVGLTLSILALVRANANRRFARDNGITESGKNIAGRWCGIGGIVMNALSVLFWLTVIVIAVLSFAIFAGNVGSEVIGVIPDLF